MLSGVAIQHLRQRSLRRDHIGGRVAVRRLLFQFDELLPDASRWRARDSACLNLAAQYADRILGLADGTCVAEGTPDAVLTPPIIQVVFHMPIMLPILTLTVLWCSRYRQENRKVMMFHRRCR